MDLTRRRFLAAAGLVSLPVDLRAADTSKTRSFWVLNLLRPTSLIVYPLGTARLHCVSEQSSWIVEGTQSCCMTPETSPVRITGPGNEPAGCVIEVAGVFRRSYFGTFDFRSNDGVMVPVVSMDCERATGSIIGAELPVYAAPLHALAAQAVVTRSILCAATKPRHAYADFCDTTHCQFLRSPAMLGGKVASAIHATAGLVLRDGRGFLTPRYSAACGGCTEAGVDRDHQYVSVICERCQSSRTVRRGHGWGLCQEGALGLARLGWSWREILTKYYPNATVSFLS